MPIHTSFFIVDIKVCDLKDFVAGTNFVVCCGAMPSQCYSFWPTNCHTTKPVRTKRFVVSFAGGCGQFKCDLFYLVIKKWSAFWGNYIKSNGPRLVVDVYFLDTYKVVERSSWQYRQYSLRRYSDLSIDNCTVYQLLITLIKCDLLNDWLLIILISQTTILH